MALPFPRVSATTQPFSIFGTNGNDFFDYSASTPAAGYHFSIHAGAGADIVYGSKHGDTIYGDAGNDFINGNGGRDTLFGGDGADIVHGGTGNDTINGGRGADFLLGDVNVVVSGPNSTVTGFTGDGADRFVFSAADMVMSQVAGIAVETYEKDVIGDFNAAEGDTIDVSSLLDNETSFAGSTAAEAFAQGYIYLVQSEDKTTVYIDRNGGGHSLAAKLTGGEFAIVELSNVSAAELSPNSFIV